MDFFTKLTKKKNKFNEKVNIGIFSKTKEAFEAQTDPDSKNVENDCIS